MLEIFRFLYFSTQSDKSRLSISSNSDFELVINGLYLLCLISFSKSMHASNIYINFPNASPKSLSFSSYSSSYGANISLNNLPLACAAKSGFIIFLVSISFNSYKAVCTF